MKKCSDRWTHCKHLLECSVVNLCFDFIQWANPVWQKIDKLKSKRNSSALRCREKQRQRIPCLQINTFSPVWRFVYETQCQTRIVWHQAIQHGFWKILQRKKIFFANQHQRLKVMEFTRVDRIRKTCFLHRQKVGEFATQIKSKSPESTENIHTVIIETSKKSWGMQRTKFDQLFKCTSK